MKLHLIILCISALLFGATLAEKKYVKCSKMYCASDGLEITTTPSQQMELIGDPRTEGLEVRLCGTENEKWLRKIEEIEKRMERKMERLEKLMDESIEKEKTDPVEVRPKATLVNRTKASCMIYGDPHYVMFEKSSSYDFMGACTYVVSQTYGIDTSDSKWFSIQVENERRYGDKRVSYVKNAKILLDGGKIEIVLDKGGIAKINGRTVLEASTPQFTLKTSGSYRTVLTQHGVELSFKDSIAIVRLPPMYRSLVQGLCGDYNGNSSDDLMMLNGSLASDFNEFGASFQVGNCSTEELPPPVQCSVRDRDHWGMDEYCGVMGQSGGYFSECNKVINPDLFISNCIFDLCATEGNPTVLLQNLENFVDACKEAGFPLCNWRKELGQPRLFCPFQSKYSGCTTSCPNTCANANASQNCDNKILVEGCVCDEGFLWEGTNCIKKDQCATLVSGISYGGIVRLANGNSTKEGRVEIFHNGEWGTVCDDMWDISDADVVCRMLGLGKAVSALNYAHYGEGKGQIWLENLKCNGDEDSITLCRHHGWGEHDCQHAEDASVVCEGDSESETMEIEITDQEFVKCTMLGDPHYSMFEASSLYDFQGKCTYIASETHLINSSDSRWFTIHVENEMRNGFESVSFVKNARIFLDGGNTDIFLDQNQEAMINGRMVLEADTANFSLKHSGKNLVVKTKYGLEVSFASASLTIRLPRLYSAQIRGLCGDYNGNTSDDLMMRNGSLAEDWNQFGDSYRVGDCKMPEIPEPIRCSAEDRKQWSVYDYCGSITNSTGYFSACAEEINAEEHFEDCLYDMCATKGDKGILLLDLGAFVSECKERGIPLCNWRTILSQPTLQCPSNSSYRGCASACPNTCANPVASENCNLPSIEACVCDQGYVLEGNRCVTTDQCRTVDERGIYYDLECLGPNEIGNGSIEPVKKYFNRNEIITFKCDRGYRLLGDSVLQCHNGNWSKPEPLCQIQCPRPTDIQFASIFPSEEYFDINDVITYYCDEGYSMFGESQRICQNSGNWSDLEPVCKVQCKCPSEVTNGRFLVLKEQYDPGEIVPYECYDGFVGNGQIVCGEDGMWENSLPSCKVSAITDDGYSNEVTTAMATSMPDVTTAEDTQWETYSSYDDSDYFWLLYNDYDITRPSECPDSRIQPFSDMPEWRDTTCVRVCENIESGTLKSSPVGFSSSGIPAIVGLGESNRGFATYCDCTEGDELAWTTILRGQKDSIKDYFQREECDYRYGFGNLTEQFWIGLQPLYRFTLHSEYSLKMQFSNTGSIEYSNFSVVKTASGFSMRISGYRGSSTFARLTQNLSGEYFVDGKFPSQWLAYMSVSDIEIKIQEKADTSI